MFIQTPTQIIDRELQENLSKLDELKDVLPIDTTEIDALREQLEKLKEQLEEAETQISELRPGSGFKSAHKKLSRQRDDVSAMLQSTSNELIQEISDLRLASYLDLFPPAVAELNEITKELDTEALIHQAKSAALMQERFDHGERIKKLNNVSGTIYDDLKGSNPTIPQLRYPSATAWRKPQLAQYRQHLEQHLDRFRNMAGVGGIPSGDDPDELYKWFARRKW